VVLTFLFLFLVWLVWCYFNFQIAYLEVKNK
jgi:hypothetical protein